MTRGWPVTLAILIVGAGAAWMFRYDVSHPLSVEGRTYIWDRWQSGYTADTHH